MKIKKFIKNNFWLLLILLIAAVLRLYKLGTIPPSLTPDEASLGYNAYSLLKTGRDEYGNFLPFILKSFGDYKPALYTYLAIPGIAIFGLTEFATRLPSAIAGVIGVWLIYLITSNLFPEQVIVKSYKLKLGEIAALLLAISPWHIHFSRGAWEVNVALTFSLAGLYFLFRSLKKQEYLMVSAFFWGLSLLTYQGAKLTSAIILVIFAVLYFKDLIKFDKFTLVKSVAIGLIVSAPVVLSVFQGKAGRLEVFSIFSYPRPEAYVQNFISEAGVTKGSLVYDLFYNEPLNFARGIIGRWYKHFSGRFLFFEGDWANPRHSAPNHGMLLLSDMLLLTCGLVFAFKKFSEHKKAYQFIFLWTILAPLPAVLSRDQVHAVRSFALVIPLTILSAIGLAFLISLMKKLINPIAKIIYFLFVFGIISGSLIYFLDAYFVHLPVHDSKLWEYGYKQIVQTVIPIQDNYQAVNVQQSFAQPYIYFLFYGVSLNPQRYDPAKYQKQANLVVADQVTDVGYIEKIDNINFVPIDWSVRRGDHGTLIVADNVRIPPADSADVSQFNLIKQINYLNGQPAFRILEIY